MKTAIASAVSLVLGMALGWCLGHHQAEREKTEIVQEMVQGIESSDSERAARAVRAIQSVEAGEPQQAVQLLSTPIAHYYSPYTAAGRNDERSAKLRASIEQLAAKNQLVAARIAEVSNTARIKTP